MTDTEEATQVWQESANGGLVNPEAGLCLEAVTRQNGSTIAAMRRCSEEGDQVFDKMEKYVPPTATLGH